MRSSQPLVVLLGLSCEGILKSKMFIMHYHVKVYCKVRCLSLYHVKVYCDGRKEGVQC